MVACVCEIVHAECDFQGQPGAAVDCAFAKIEPFHIVHDFRCLIFIVSVETERCPITVRYSARFLRRC